MNNPYDKSWLEAFTAAKGRPPRILHIGNIANNAYLNAKILNRAGIPCDVLCYDYYHVMGCPEWEDAEVGGDMGDMFLPRWDKADLNGFSRPRWFVQGPARLALCYLDAKNTGREKEAGFLWRCLAEAQKRPHTAGRVLRLARIANVLFTRHRRLLLMAAGGWLVLYLLSPLLALAALPVLALPPFFLLGRHRIARSRFAKMPGIRHCLEWSELLAEKLRQGRKAEIPARLRELEDKFRELFPDRPDELSARELLDHEDELWRRVLLQYDAVVGYATDGIYPLVAGKRPYFAYEHGTIRNIPFQDTAQGRLCALTYKMADTCFITNCDNIAAAEKLKLPEFRFIPHPINEDAHPEDAALLRARLEKELGCDFICFHPSRQHWEERRHPDWEKGNDIFIRGFARFAREVNPKAAAVLVDWGQKVPESKALLAELGVADRVLWIPPQPNMRMVAYIMASDLLADQFFLGAFGSTMPKALLHGCPAMLYLDEERHRWCFPEMPPVLNARSEEEVFEGLSRLYREPGFKEDLIARGRDWYASFHSNRVIGDTFTDVLSKKLPAGADKA